MVNMTPKELKKKEKALAKSWKKRALPVIEYMPDAYNKESKRRLIQGDEEKLILKYTGGHNALVIGIVFVFIFGLIFFLGKEEIEQKFGLIMGIIGLISLIYEISLPKKYWVFNRKTQMVTVPGRHYTKGHDIPMDEMRIKEWMTMSNVGVSRVFPVAVVPSSKFEEFLGVNISELETLNQAGKLYKLWSYYVWYMDENRPLPPGKIFDHCREREFNNRKRRGFPMPMYYSLVPTPEATPEFQKERDKYWTDEMFCPDINKYGECCLESGKINIPKPLLFYNPKNNPENWERILFKDSSGFKYKPDVRWVRYVFDNKKVVYTLNISDRILIPPKGTSYTTEYIRKNYMDIKPYYEKELKELREKAGVEV